MAGRAVDDQRPLQSPVEGVRQALSETQDALGRRLLKKFLQVPKPLLASKFSGRNVTLSGSAKVEQAGIDPSVSVAPKMT